MLGAIKINNNVIRWAFSALLSVLILFSTYRNVFSIAALALCSLMIFFCNREFVLLQLFFIMPMAGIFKMSPGTISFFTILLLLYVMLHLVLPRKATAIIALFAFYVIIGELCIGQFDVFKTIKFVCNVLFLSSILNSKIEVRHKEIFLSYIVGNIVASFFGMMDSPIFKIKQYVGETELGGVEFEDFSRFTGLNIDPNYYAVGLIVSLCLIVVLIHRNEIKNITAIVLSACMLYFIIQTYSKSAFLMLLLVIAFLLFSFYIRRKYAAIIVLSVSVFTVAVLVLSGKIPAFEVVMARFAVSDTMQGVDVNKLTTGRWDLWTMYFKYSLNNIRSLLIGDSISKGYLNGRAAHNTYLEAIYHIGVAGWSLLVGSLMAISQQSRHFALKRNALNYSVLLCVLILYFFLSELFSYDPPFHLFLSFTVLNLPLQKTNKAENIRLKKA